MMPGKISSESLSLVMRFLRISSLTDKTSKPDDFNAPRVLASVTFFSHWQSYRDQYKQVADALGKNFGLLIGFVGHDNDSLGGRVAFDRQIGIIGVQKVGKGLILHPRCFALLLGGCQAYIDGTYVD